MPKIMGKVINTELELYLSRTSGGNPEHFRLEVVDKRSRLVLLNARIPTYQIANLISTRPVHVEDATLYRSLAFGKYMDYRTINVPIGADTTNDDVMKTMKAFVKENWGGWELDVGEDEYNFRSRKQVGYNNFYEVRIIRFTTEKPSDPPARG